MSTRKSLSLAAIMSLFALAACSDVTAPSAPSGFCPVTNGPGVCAGAAVQH